MLIRNSKPPRAWSYAPLKGQGIVAMNALVRKFDRVPLWVFGTPLAILFIFTGTAGEHAANGGFVPAWWLALDQLGINLLLPVMIIWLIKAVRTLFVA